MQILKKKYGKSQFFQQRVSTVVEALAFHENNPGLIPGTADGSPRTNGSNLYV